MKPCANHISEFEELFGFVWKGLERDIYLQELSKTVKSERLFGPSSKAMRAHEQHGQVASLTAPRKNLSLNNLKIKTDMFNKCSTCSLCLWMVHIKMISSNQTLTQVSPHAQSPLTYTAGRTHLDLRMTDETLDNMFGT
jgi:hypothetical protein